MALHNGSLEVAEGSVVRALLGLGKSTILMALSGLIPITSGEIWFMDRRIDGMETPEIINFSIAHIPEGRKLFPYLTVLNNLKLGANLRKDKEEINKDLDKVFMRFHRLREMRN